MENWQEFDDYMIYNEENKHVIIWCTYGDETKYFLSQEYFYEGEDFLDENYSEDTYTLVNEEITEDNTLEILIAKTKDMR